MSGALLQFLLGFFCAWVVKGWITPKHVIILCDDPESFVTSFKDYMKKSKEKNGQDLNK